MLKVKNKNKIYTQFPKQLREREYIKHINSLKSIKRSGDRDGRGTREIE